MTRGSALRLCLALASVVITLVPGTAHARQLSAGNPPTVSGPLSSAGYQCTDQKLKHEGKVIAKLESCIWVYRFDEAMETDLFKTYGAVWMQSTVDPVNGWCATKVPTEISIPQDAQRESFAPTGSTAIGDAKKVTTKLVVDASGAAMENGRVSNAYKLYRRSLKTTSLDGGRTTRFTWTGQESRKLAFVGGVQASWSTIDAPQFRAGFDEMSFIKTEGC
jgi:hypothetical protein